METGTIGFHSNIAARLSQALPSQGGETAVVACAHAGNVADPQRVAAQVVTAALAFATSRFPPEADEGQGGTAKECGSHSHVRRMVFGAVAVIGSKGRIPRIRPKARQEPGNCPGCQLDVVVDKHHPR